jgi:hypothetical protein
MFDKSQNEYQNKIIEYKNNITNIDIYNTFEYPQHKFTNTLILYVFHEYNDRVKNFIDNCLFEDDKYTFIFIINNKSFDVSILKLPLYVKYILRDNIGYDFGGWSEGLLINYYYKNFDSFIFINSSVYGPCMDMNDNRLWPDILLNGLNYNNIKLFGTTINCIDNPHLYAHVQSMAFCMDLITLEYLLKKNIFSLTNYSTSYIDTIWKKEIQMSREIINNNWNIGCLHTYYNDIDFTFKSKNREIIYLNNVFAKNMFFGKTINPHEILFIKGNKNIEPNIIKQYIKYKNSFGFIILRHVNSKITNEYWKESYRCIRKLYPNNKIIIIDDNSNYSFIDNQDFLINCTIINSEFPKRGELLPYIYIYKNKFFDTAIIIHDSVFIQNYIDFTNYNNVKFLWDFEKKTFDDVNYIKFLISKLNYSDKILEVYDNADWKGCFGVMSVIKYDFLKHIIEKYNMLNLIDYITERDHRCCLERIFAIICYVENLTTESYFNKIHDYIPWMYTFEEYKNNKINKDIIKVWTGR